jgi:hypothetical protein
MLGPTAPRPVSSVVDCGARPEGPRVEAATFLKRQSPQPHDLRRPPRCRAESDTAWRANPKPNAVRRGPGSTCVVRFPSRRRPRQGAVGQPCPAPRSSTARPPCAAGMCLVEPGRPGATSWSRETSAAVIGQVGQRGTEGPPRDADLAASRLDRSARRWTPRRACACCADTRPPSSRPVAEVRTVGGEADSWLETFAHNRSATRYRTPGPNGNMV